METKELRLRPIEERDNEAMAAIIRRTLEEFGANRPGTVYYDPTTDALYQLFSGAPRAAYLVAEHQGRLLGGGGIFPTEGLPADTCELVKMYLLPEARGIGLGKAIIQQALDLAAAAGFKNVYLETMPELSQARHTYARFGFRYLDGPLCNSGHFGCDLWMMKRLEE